MWTPDENQESLHNRISKAVQVLRRDQRPHQGVYPPPLATLTTDPSPFSRVLLLPRSANLESGFDWCSTLLCLWPLASSKRPTRLTLSRSGVFRCGYILCREVLSNALMFRCESAGDVKGELLLLFAMFVLIEGVKRRRGRELRFV